MTPDGIRLTTIEALFSDPHLGELLVLKGGNALNLIHGIGGRSSLDIDLSLLGDLVDFAETGERIQAALERTFARHGYSAFDCQMSRKPSTSLPGASPEWGGYEAVFKVIGSASSSAPLELRRRKAAIVGPLHERVVRVQISKYEFCGNTISVDVGESRVTVYTPAMIAVEKLRAICQQMPEYQRNRKPRPRARDFYDIHAISIESSVDLTTPPNVELVRRSFRAKEVETVLLARIAGHREFHRLDWPSVEDAVVATPLDFDFYFDSVVMTARRLGSLLG